MCSTKLLFPLVLSFFGAVSGYSQSAEPIKADPVLQIPLEVETGVPLRLYLTERLTKRQDETVHARLIEPIFAFDREVIPANTEALGRVVHVDSVSRIRRATAIAGGDFTPLHDAEVEFDTLILPDGRRLSVHTTAALPLTSLYSPRVAAVQKQTKANANSQSGRIAQAKQQARDQVRTKIASTLDMVKAPGKMERAEDFVVAKLPYHPQWIRRGTRLDAELREPMDFGLAQVPASSLRMLGSQPPPDSTVQVRLVTPLSSSNASLGEKVEAILSQPLFSRDHNLIFPEGTRLTGAVTVARGARWLHRGGRLRFSFRDVELPPQMDALLLKNAERPPDTSIQTIATLNAVEPSGSAAVKVDEEGEAKASEPKTRFIAPAISFLIATRAADNDAGRARLQGTATGNTGARALGGALGFGLIGTIASHASPTFAGVMGFYGMGWSVFNNVISRGSEVEFGENAAMDIRFGARPPVHGSKLKPSPADAAGAGR